MPSEKSARVARKGRERNQPVRTKTRTLIAGARTAISAGDDGAGESVRQAVIALDKAAQKGVVHRGNAARRKSRLMKQLNASKS